MYEENFWLYKVSLEANTKTFHNIDWIVLLVSLPFFDSFVCWVGLSCCLSILTILDILFSTY